MSYHILVIDDEPQMRDLIRMILEEAGYLVEEAGDGIQALAAVKQHDIDLCIVDVMMPYMDGFTFAEEVKRLSEMPLIFLSARGEEWDKVQGLKLGGDDYIVKPFMPGELVARIEAVLRRTFRQNPEPFVLQAGPLTINEDSYTAQLDSRLLNLTLKEFNLLLLLTKNKGRAYSREQLLELIWGNDHQSSERTIDTHIKTLRLKLGDAGKMIETVWGIGYKFEDPQ
ncbi:MULTISPECIES: response regulator transcription factor [unclassified Sporosarcina]|uniref:response regulator transcription factor n=1 Tax=unclassified Sporosarcina TaxID=2647733 RepID=UPI00203FF858|nr:MULTISPECIES: response regulator transcription factor [unclassified Sporosarcina]GKV64687.1 DNA-binding response regulator [Sporosarcina sp. NCCP-2331]GLB54797.1 DNA-binding response regulator [Sporosarcina sp. NCCP-2378]